LIENKTENKLVDQPLGEHDPTIKIKGFNNYIKNLEKQKEELEKKLEEQGIVSKKDVVAPIVEVVSMNKKERPPEIEEDKDEFFVKHDTQEKTKKKKTKQHQGPKNIPVSEVLHVKPRRHRGFNTVPEENQERKEKRFQTKTEQKETKEETKTEQKENKKSEWDEPLEDSTKGAPVQSGWDSPKETKETKETKENTTGGWDSPKETKQGWGDKKENNQWSGERRGQGNPRKQPSKGNPRRTRIDIESTQQFPPLSENIIPQAPLTKWGPGQN